MESHEKIKNNEKIHPHTFIYLIFGLLVIIIIIISTVIIVENKKKPLFPAELLDVTVMTEDQRSIIVETFKIKDGSISLKKCQQHIKTKEIDAILSYKSIPKSAFINSGNTRIKLIINQSFNYILPKNKPLTTSPQSIIDIDYDGLEDFIYICSRYNNCPISLDGKALAVNLSSQEKNEYLVIRNKDESSVDLTRPGQIINTESIFIKGGLFGIQITGETKEVSYALGMNNEIINLFSSAKKINSDLDLDGYNEQIIITEDLIYLFITTSENPLIIKRTPSDDYILNINDYLHYSISIIDSEIIIEPIYSEMYYTIDPLVMNSNNSFSSGDVIRIYSPLPFLLKNNQQIKINLLCGGLEHETRYII